MADQEHHEDLVVTRQRAVGPLPRFIDVPDGQLLAYFQSVLPVDQEGQVSELQLLLEGVSTHQYSVLKRHLEADFSFFAGAAAGTTNLSGRPDGATLDAQERRFVGSLIEVLHACHYTPLSRSQWEASEAEDFLVTLPVSVNWGGLDTALLARHWSEHPALRAVLPDEVADRLLIFHRGLGVAKLEGTYFSLKVNLLISFFILQPLWALLRAAARALRLGRYVAQAPPGMEGPAADCPQTVALAERVASQRSGTTDQPSILVERRTFARLFPDGRSVLRAFFKKVSLQEATFRNVVVMYRRAVPDKKVPHSELEIIRDDDPAFRRRNIVVKMFRDVPLADLCIICPDTQIFVPPQVFVNMVVTIVGGLVATITALVAADKLSASTVFSALSLLGARVGQVYSAGVAQKALVGRQMGNVVYDRSVASQEAVLTTLTEDMRSHRTRELFICYCVLLHAGKPLSESELDKRCERLLAQRWGHSIDFTCEDALPTLKQWEMVVPGPGGTVQAQPLKTALEKLDAVWDGLFDYSEGSGNSTLRLATLGRGPSGGFSGLPGLSMVRGSRKVPEPAAPPATAAGKPGVSAPQPAASGSSAVSAGTAGGPTKKKGFVKRIFS